METTVVKGLKILEVLAEADHPASLGEISEACGLSKSNVHRLLRTLEACGYVNQEASSRKYYATLRMWELGTRTHDRLDFRAIARPHLIQLVEETEETVHLSVFDGSEVLFVDKIDGSHAVRTYVNVGDRAPSYCSASGKAMLAHMPNEVIDAVGQTIQRHTKNTVGSLAELRKHLAAIRDAGYSLTLGEWRQDVTGIASAIISDSGKVIGAIGVAGPQDRMRQSRHERYIEAVLAARDRIRQDIGFGTETATRYPLDAVKRAGAKRSAKTRKAG